MKIRENLKDFKPYQPLDYKAEIKLDANESPYNLPDNAMDKIRQKISQFQFNRYPDPDGKSLRKKLANLCNVSVDNIVLGNGGDEILLNTYLAFGGAGRKAVTFAPTFSVYEIYAKLTSTEFVNIERGINFEVNEREIDQAIKENPDIVFICSPNNPTGTETSKQLIKKLANSIDGLVIADEAYGEFSENNLLELAGTKNLAVLKTFSKAYSLASMRLGYLIAQKEIIDELMKVKLPFNNSSFSTFVAEICLEYQDEFSKRVEIAKNERNKMISELSDIKDIEIYPSGANYIFFKTPVNSKIVFNKLIDKGILIRHFFDNPRLSSYLRVTVGSPEENIIFLKELSNILRR